MKINQNIAALVFTLLIVVCIKGYFGLIDSKVAQVTKTEEITTIIKQSDISSSQAVNLFEEDAARHDVKINENMVSHYRIVNSFPVTLFGIISQHTIAKLYSSSVSAHCNYIFFKPDIPLYISYRVLLI